MARRYFPCQCRRKQTLYFLGPATSDGSLFGDYRLYECVRCGHQFFDGYKENKINGRFKPGVMPFHDDDPYAKKA